MSHLYILITFCNYTANIFTTIFYLIKGVEFSEVRFPIGADFAHPEFTLFKVLNYFIQP